MADVSYEDFVAAWNQRHGDGKSEGQRTIDKALAAQPISLGGGGSLRQAATEDLSTASRLLDFTNPRNFRPAAAVAAQVIPTIMLGPEAPMLMKMLAAGTGSMAGGAISRGQVDPSKAALDFVLGAGTEGAVQGGGAIARRISGKAGLEAERASAESAYQAQVLKHTDAAVTDISKAQNEEELARQIRQSIGVPTPLENPTIETLSARVTPVRESAQRSIRGVFRGLSGKFQSTLQPFYNLPVDTANYANTVEAERAMLTANKESVSPKLEAVMRDIERRSPATIPVDINRPGQMTQEQLGKRVRGALRPQDLATNVQDIDGIRRQLTEVVTGSGSATDKRVANRLIGALDKSLQPVLPENVQADWTNLRREWREANAVFSPNFRSTLFKADTPAAVADALYGAAKGNKAHRVMTVIGQTPKDEIPLLRSAFAEKLAQGDVVKNVEGLDPRVFKALYGGTGFDSPKAWVEALQTNVVKRLGLEEIAKDPVLSARLNQRVQEGMRSLGASRYSQVIAKAEETLRSVKNPGDVITEAMRGDLPETLAEARTRGELEGMRRPMLGRVQGWMEHRVAIHTALAMVSLGGMYAHSPVATIAPLAYIGSSKAAAGLLANPRVANAWREALTSKNWEQFGFWLGRLTAASLTEGMREADSADSEK